MKLKDHLACHATVVHVTHSRDANADLFVVILVPFPPISVVNVLRCVQQNGVVKNSGKGPKGPFSKSMETPIHDKWTPICSLWTAIGGLWTPSCNY